MQADDRQQYGANHEHQDQGGLIGDVETVISAHERAQGDNAQKEKLGGGIVGGSFP